MYGRQEKKNLNNKHNICTIATLFGLVKNFNYNAYNEIICQHKSQDIIHAVLKYKGRVPQATEDPLDRRTRQLVGRQKMVWAIPRGCQEI